MSREEIEQKLNGLRKIKYDWEFSGSSDARMKWLDKEIKSYEKLLTDNKN